MIDIFFSIPQKLRYLLVGGFNTFFGLGVFAVFHYFLGDKFFYQVILLLSYCVNVFLSFLTMKFLVFQAKGGFFGEYIRCNLVYLFLLVVNLLLLSLFVEIFKFKVVFAQFLCTIIVAVIGFVIHKKFSFRV